tara:strand:+ start:4019 stop:5134 length:1116 start_codon:yes stop_codon:yes gene_type:complete
MGNVLSADDNENTVLKKIYKLNKNELDTLASHISKQKISNIETGFINSLINLNNTLRGKIPESNLNLVNNFFTLLNNNTTNNVNESNKNQSYSKQEVLKLFNIDKNFTIEQLKLSYKKLAMVHHPDRPTGNNNKFQLITKLYLALVEESKLKEKDKQFRELKNNSHDFIKKQENNNERNYKLDRFEPKLFNKIFDETKIQDEDSNGYKDWIEGNQLEEKDVEKNKNLDSSFTLDSFNTIFNKKVDIKKEIVEYKIPVAMDSSNNMSHSELGGKTGNYTTNNYSDFKEAHTTSRIIPQNIKRDQYKSVGHLESERSNIKKLTQEELDELNQYDIYKKKQEEERLNNVNIRDKLHSNNHKNIHHKMLNNNILR